MSNTKILKLHSDGSFRMKYQVETLEDIAKILSFLDKIHRHANEGHQTVKIAKMLQEKIECMDIVDLVLEYITFIDSKTGTPYIDLISEQLSCEYRTFSDDPIQQLRMERWHRMGRYGY